MEWPVVCANEMHTLKSITQQTELVGWSLRKMAECKISDFPSFETLLVHSLLVPQLYN